MIATEVKQVNWEVEVAKAIIKHYPSVCPACQREIELDCEAMVEAVKTAVLTNFRDIFTAGVNGVMTRFQEGLNVNKS